jgi:hypothetical protein
LAHGRATRIKIKALYHGHILNMTLSRDEASKNGKGFVVTVGAFCLVFPTLPPPLAAVSVTVPRVIIADN